MGHHFQSNIGDKANKYYLVARFAKNTEKPKSRFLELYEEEVIYQKEQKENRLKEIRKIEVLLKKKRVEFLKVKPKK